MLIRGVLPPVITPFTADGDLDQSAFTNNIQRWNNTRLAGLLVNGSNSEAAYLNWEERLQLVKLASKYLTAGRHLMAGTGCESLRETTRFTQACADAGAQSALVLTPSYYGGAMTSTALIRFFTSLADASPIPILIYNVPKFTHVNIKADAVAELSKHPNIAGMKDSTGDIPQLVSFLNVADPNFQILVGTASAWFPALCLGVQGAIMALANCLPDACARVQELYEAGESAKAQALYQVLFPVNTAVTGTYGVPGLKAACDMEGFHGGHVRSPLLDSSPEDRDKIAGILQTAHDKMASLGVQKLRFSGV